MIQSTKSLLLIIQVLILTLFMGCQNSSKNSSSETSDKSTHSNNLNGDKHISNSSNFKIGVIQYNVKYDTRKNIWGDKGFRAKQVQAMVNIINSNKSVDFIALEQAPNYLDDEPTSPKLDTLLPGKLKTKYTTAPNNDLLSPNSEPKLDYRKFDGIQITYNNTKWQIIGKPLSGYWKGTYDRTNKTLVFQGTPDVRPYSAAYFQNKDDENIKLIFVATHFPHPSDGWNWDFFKNDLLALVDGDESKLKTTTIVMSGDYNTPSTAFKDNNNLKSIGNFEFLNVNKEEDATCCSDDGFVNHFDYIGISNGGKVVFDYTIVPDTGNISGDTQKEEHKSIYVEATIDNT